MKKKVLFAFGCQEVNYGLEYSMFFIPILFVVFLVFYFIQLKRPIHRFNGKAKTGEGDKEEH